MTIYIGSTAISKIYLGSTQISNSYLGSTLVGGTPLIPAMTALTDLPNLVIDFDAADTATISATGALVNTWTNKGSYGGSATSTSTNRPSTGTRTMNSLNTLDFSGTNHMDMSTEPGALTAAAYTLFRVWYNDLNATAAILDLAQTALAGNIRSGLQVDVGNTDNRIYQYSGASAITDGAAPESGPGPAITTLRGEAAIAYNYINSLTRSGANGTPTYSTSTVWRLGGDPDNTSTRWNGAISQMAGYNRTLTLDEQQLVEGFLAWKWGLQANLFSGNEWAAKDPRTNARVSNVVAWGDSFTENAFLSSVDRWPAVLQTLSGRKVSNQGIGGETSTQIATRANADVKYTDRIRVIWAGTNGPTGGSTVLGDIQAMVNYQPTTKFIILPSINSSTEPSGSGGYINKASNNAAVQAAYPSNWLDVRAMMIALQTPSGPYPDATALAGDYVGAALRTDALHWNATAYALVAQWVKDFITAKGW